MPKTDRFPQLRALARAVRRLPPEVFDLRAPPGGNSTGSICALGIALRFSFVPELSQFTARERAYLFNTYFHERRRIKPISWYSRVMRFIKRKEAQQCQHA